MGGYLTICRCTPSPSLGFRLSGGRVVWVPEGDDRKTLQEFSVLLGSCRLAGIRRRDADAVACIAASALDACGERELRLGPFHLVRWATDAPDVLRRRVWNALRKAGVHREVAALKNCRYALGKNRLANGLTERVNTKLRILTRMADGFEASASLIALGLFDRGGCCPPLPRRT